MTLATLVVGHRGCMAESPENTMASFRRALDQGAEMVELDVQLSGDGIPVVIHDDTLTRVSNGTSTLAVGASSLAELQQADVGQGERVPTLEQVLAELCPRIPVNVEMKYFNMHCRPLCQGVADVIRRLGVEKRVLVTSFFHGSLPVVRRFCPELATGRLYYPTSTGPLYPDDAAEIFAREPHPTFVMEHGMVDAKTVELVRSGNGRLFVYTVNEEEDMRRLLGLGVDGIISNRPGVLKAVRDSA